jgi:hypothetical protein
MSRAGLAKQDQCSGSDEITSDAGGAISTPGPNSEPDFPSVADLVDTFVNMYYPGLLGSVHACLAVVGSMALNGRTKPLSLILETPSGYGKTAVVQMFFPSQNSGVEEFIYRSDKFTPKSFVSHAANVKKRQLAEVDLLPKLENKVLVTKELAPLFRGREEEMQENFSMLISVLDGKGFTSDTGMHGQRGYQRNIMFNWIGATTPLPMKVHHMMSQLGTRLLFYEVPANPPTEDELVKYARAEQASSAEVDCQCVVELFLSEFFRAHPVGSVPPESIRITETQYREIVRWAQFLVAARAEILSEKIGSNWTPVSAMRPEGPWKVVTYFQDLARGHAVICDRDHVDASDLALIADVAISSTPGHLRPLVRALRCGSLNTNQAERMCGVTAPTARNYMTQLSLLRIVKFRAGSPQTNKPDTITFLDPYNWMKVEP